MRPIHHFLAGVSCSIVIVPIVWWLMDRDPPYTRETGELFPVSHKMCGLETGPPHQDGVIRPGSCVEVRWTIVPMRTCKPFGKFSVTRAIVDQQGRHTLPATNSIYSARSPSLPPDPSTTESLARYFALPANGPVGPATYEVAAAFACNKLQEFFWPIVVDKPDIKFMVGELPTLGPR